MKAKLASLVLIYLMNLARLAAQDSLNLQSPNGSLKFAMAAGEDGLMRYSINYSNK
jgi:hypothetical protein